MSETLQLVTLRFNKSLRFENRPDRLTGELDATLLREIMKASEIVFLLGERLHDLRRQVNVVHNLPSLTHTTVLLAVQGWAIMMMPTLCRELREQTVPLGVRQLARIPLKNT